MGIGVTSPDICTTNGCVPPPYIGGSATGWLGSVGLRSGMSKGQPQTSQLAGQPWTRVSQAGHRPGGAIRSRISATGPINDPRIHQVMGWRRRRLAYHPATGPKVAAEMMSMPAHAGRSVNVRPPRRSGHGCPVVGHRGWGPPPRQRAPGQRPNGTSGTPTIPRRSIQARRVHVGRGDGVRVARMVAASPPEIDLDAVRRRTAKARMYRDRNVPNADSPRYRDVSVL